MLENPLLGMADWLMHQGEGWQGGFAALHGPHLTVFQMKSRSREDGGKRATVKEGKSLEEWGGIKSKA